MEAKALPATGDFGGVLGVGDGGRNAFLYKTLMLPLVYVKTRLGAQ